LHEIGMVLASGRIPGNSAGSQRASFMLAPGMSAKRLSTASRNSRIELSEYSNGDIAFNIVQSLRRGQNVGDGDRATYYPMDLHRRQTSDNSFEEELRAIANSSANSSDVHPEADTLQLLIKRQQNPQTASEDTDPETARRALAQLQMLAVQRQQSHAVTASSDQGLVSAAIYNSQPTQSESNL
jgi:hypothetical protein